MTGDERITLTEKQKRAQRSRSVALALVLVAFVVLVYLGSIAKFGAALTNQPL